MKETIRLTPGGGPRILMPDNIEAEVIGPFGIFRLPEPERWWPESGGWNITHVPSGLKLCACKTKADAVACIAEIMALPDADTIMRRVDPLQELGTPFRTSAAAIVGKYRTW